MPSAQDRFHKEGLTYDDVLLVPAYSEILPKDTNTSSYFTRKIKLKIPAGTESHTHFRLAKQGMTFIDSKKRGDLFVRIIVDIPKLNKDKEKIFKNLFE